MIVSFQMPQDVYIAPNLSFNVSWRAPLGYTFNILTIYYKYQDSSIWNSVQILPISGSANDTFDLTTIYKTFTISGKPIKLFTPLDYKIDVEFSYIDEHSGNMVTGHETSDQCIVMFKSGVEQGILKVKSEDEFYSYDSDNDYDFGDEISGETTTERDWDFDTDIQDERYDTPHVLDFNLETLGEKEHGYPVFELGSNNDDTRNALSVKVKSDRPFASIPLVDDNSPLASDVKINHNGFNKSLAKDEPEFHYSNNYGSGYTENYYQTYDHRYNDIYYVRYSRETLYDYQAVYNTYQLYNTMPSYSFYANYAAYDRYSGPHAEVLDIDIIVNEAKYYYYNGNFINYEEYQTTQPVKQFVKPYLVESIAKYNYKPIKYYNDGYFYVNASYVENFTIEPHDITYYYSNESGYYYYYGYNHILYSTPLANDLYQLAYNYDYSGNLVQKYDEFYQYYTIHYTYAYGGTYAYDTQYTPHYGYYYYYTMSYNTIHTYKYYAYNASYYYYRNNLYYSPNYTYAPIYTYYVYSVPNLQPQGYNNSAYFYSYYTLYNGLAYGSYPYSYSWAAYGGLYDSVQYVSSFYTYYVTRGPEVYYYTAVTPQNVYRYAYYNYYIRYQYYYSSRHDYSYSTPIARYRYGYGSSYRVQDGYYYATGYSAYTYSAAQRGYNRSTRRYYTYYTYYTYYISFRYTLPKYYTRADRYSYVSSYSYRTESYTYYTYSSSTAAYLATDSFAYLSGYRNFYYRDTASYYYRSGYTVTFYAYYTYLWAYYTYYNTSSGTAYYPFYYYSSSSPIPTYYYYWQDTSYYYFTPAYAPIVSNYYAYITGYRTNYSISTEYMYRYNYDRTTYNSTYYTTNYHLNNPMYTYYTSGSQLYIYNIYSYPTYNYTSRTEGYNYKYKYYYGTYRYDYYYLYNTYYYSYGYYKLQYNTVYPYTYNYRYHEVVGYYTVTGDDIITNAYIVPKYNDAYYTVTENIVYNPIEPTYSDSVYGYIGVNIYYSYANALNVAYHNYRLNYNDNHNYYNYEGIGYYAEYYNSRLDYYYQAIIGYNSDLEYYYTYITGYFDHNMGIDKYAEYAYTEAVGHIDKYYYSGKNTYPYSYNYIGYYYDMYKHYYYTYNNYNDISYYYKNNVFYARKAYSYVIEGGYALTNTVEPYYIGLIQTYPKSYGVEISIENDFYKSYNNIATIEEHGTYIDNDTIKNYTKYYNYYYPTAILYARRDAIDHSIYTGSPKTYMTRKYVNDGA